jgi:hypothetical protein
MRRQARRSQQRGDLVGQGGRPGRVAAQLVERVRNPEKSSTASWRGAASSTGSRVSEWTETARIAFGRPKAAAIASARRRQKAPA